MLLLAHEEGFRHPPAKVRVDIAPPIHVPPDADDNLLEAKREELQAALDTINERGEQWRGVMRANGSRNL